MLHSNILGEIQLPTNPEYTMDVIPIQHFALYSIQIGLDGFQLDLKDTMSESDLKCLGRE